MRAAHRRFVAAWLVPSISGAMCDASLASLFTSRCWVRVVPDCSVRARVKIGPHDLIHIRATFAFDGPIRN